MMRFKTEKLILEGPDLSGKTSLYEEIHRKTNYKWNIQDRSALSMLCYAIQFERDESDFRRDLYKELTNLNNRVVVLMPSLDTIRSRYEVRGDDLQDEASLRHLHSIFKEEVSHIKDLPNVLVIEERHSVSSSASRVINWLDAVERRTCPGNFVRNFVESAQGDEHVLQFETTGKILKDYDESILDDPLEGKYYREILSDFCHIIQKEILGLNEYGVSQTVESRRFYYSSRSCISSLHFKPRGKNLEFICSFRSTNAQKNASIDFQFLVYLVHRIGKEYFSDCEKYTITTMMNSAHLIRQ